MAAAASTTNMDMGFATLSLNNQSFSSSDLGIPQLNLSGDSIFSDQDLLTLILVRVPLKKVTQFKCVSKPWLFLINSPYFSNLRCMLPRPPPFGLFFQSSPVCNRFERFKIDPVYYFPVQDGYNDNNHHHKAPFFFPDILLGHDLRGYPNRILDSSHGLLLCTTSFLLPETERDNYIYNPTTNELVTLPRPSDQSMVCSASMVLAFHPSYSPHYKIIACAAIPQNIPDRDHVHFIRQFEIYSSETRCWRVSGQPFTTPVRPKFRDGVYCNGSVYYPDELDSEEADCQYFNLEDERLHTFPRPPTRSLRRSFYFGESDDHLHFVEVCPHATLLLVYEMNCDHSGWFVKYQVDLAPLCKTFPQFHGHEYLVSVISIARRDKFQEDDSFLVLAICDKVVIYNLVNTSLKKMFDICEAFDIKWPHIHKEFKAWQYVEVSSAFCHTDGG